MRLKGNQRMPSVRSLPSIASLSLATPSRTSCALPFSVESSSQVRFSSFASYSESTSWLALPAQPANSEMARTPPRHGRDSASHRFSPFASGYRFTPCKPVLPPTVKSMAREVHSSGGYSATLFSYPMDKISVSPVPMFPSLLMSTSALRW